MGKKDKRLSTGRIHIICSPKFDGETFIITSIDDESKFYYLPASSFGGSSISMYIDILPGHYIVKLMKKDRQQLVTVVENGYQGISWRDEWL